MHDFDEEFAEGKSFGVDEGGGMDEGGPIRENAVATATSQPPNHMLTEEMYNEEEALSKDFTFKVGMELSSLENFKKDILEHNVLNGREVYGLVQVLEEEYPGYEHRFCLRHLYAKFKNKFRGGTLFRDLMMATTNATYYEAHEAKMIQVKERGPNKPKKLRRREPDEATQTRWKRTNTNLKCNDFLKYGHNKRTCNKNKQLVVIPGELETDVETLTHVSQTPTVQARPKKMGRTKGNVGGKKEAQVKRKRVRQQLQLLHLQLKQMDLMKL
ncbi:hypothetical protein KIW84_061306 [Lathyrus oleraceus]|uniref:Uncharacterized protein n=1 Tax=Pisum sativum TaxID=3888 RepID=A0A9D5A513_PEA|nr:hypothetical protein KIW84_061306 [Pisum sativum]